MIGHETTWNIWQDKQTDMSNDNIQSLEAFTAVPFGMVVSSW